MSEIVLGNYTYRVVAEKLNITSNEVTVRMPGAPTPEPTGTPKPYNGYAWTKYNCMYFSAPRANKAYKVGEIPGNTLLNVIRLEYDNGDTAWAYVASDDGAYVGYVRNNALRYVSNTNTATNKLRIPLIIAPKPSTSSPRPKFREKAQFKRTICTRNKPRYATFIRLRARYKFASANSVQQC